MKKLGLIIALGLALAGQAFGQTTITAALLPNGEQTFVDPNGAPYAAGTVSFFIPNTTTPKTTWQDPFQIVANSNPVVLDGAGRAVVYGSGQYTEVLKDQFGTIIWTKLTNSGPSPIANNVIDFGADPTGVRDSTQAFVAAMASCDVYVPAGTYKTSDVIGTGSCVNVSLRGAGSAVTTINSSAATKYVINNSATNGIISGLTVTHSVTPGPGTGGGLAVESTTNQFKVVDIRSTGNWDGVLLGSTAWSYLDKVTSDNNYGNGFYLVNLAFGSPDMQWQINHVLAQFNNGWGYLVNNVQPTGGAIIVAWNDVSSFANTSGGICICAK